MSKESNVVPQEEENITIEDIKRDLKNAGLANVLDIVLHNDRGIENAKKEGKTKLKIGELEMTFDEWTEMIKEVLKEKNCDYDKTMKWFAGQIKEVKSYLIEKRECHVIDKNRDYILVSPSGSFFNLYGLFDYGNGGIVYYGVATVKRMMKVFELLDENFISEESFSIPQEKEETKRE